MVLHQALHGSSFLVQIARLDDLRGGLRSSLIINCTAFGIKCSGYVAGRVERLFVQLVYGISFLMKAPFYLGIDV
jgi:hypothetical protein